MTRPNGGWRCSYGAWHDLYETCKCWETPAAVLAPVPAITPTDLRPVADRPGTTVRYRIDEHRRPVLCAVLNHPAETVVRRPRFAKEVRA